MDSNILRLYDKEGKECCIIVLTDAGKTAYEAGEKLDFFNGHYNCVIDSRRILLAEF